MNMIERLEDYLDNEMDEEEIVQLFNTAFEYDGSFNFLDTYGDAFEIAKAIINGDVTDEYKDVRYDSLGNLESVTEEDLLNDCRNSTEAMALWLLDNADNVRTQIDSEILEIMDEEQEDE